MHVNYLTSQLYWKFTAKSSFSAISKSFRIRLRNNFLRNQSTSTSNNMNKYTLEEISIPNGKNYTIACKVWKGEKVTGVDEEVPIICVHGWLDNANSFDHLLPKIIRPNRTIYVFDLPGHGLSSHIDITHYSNHVNTHLDIHRLVRHLKFDKITLVGHSMGAEAAVMFAATHPEFVHKLVTIDGVNPKLPDWVYSVRIFVESLFSTEDLLLKSPHQPLSTYPELLARMLKARNGVLTEKSCRVLLERGAVQVSEGKFRFSHDLKQRIPPGMGFMTTEQMTEFCAALKCPVCVIKAANSDYFSEQAAKDFMTAMNNAKTENPDIQMQFHTVDGNHHVHLNDPDNVAPIIVSFLDS